MRFPTTVKFVMCRIFHVYQTNCVKSKSKFCECEKQSTSFTLLVCCRLFFNVITCITLLHKQCTTVIQATVSHLLPSTDNFIVLQSMFRLHCTQCLENIRDKIAGFELNDIILCQFNWWEFNNLITLCVVPVFSRHCTFVMALEVFKHKVPVLMKLANCMQMLPFIHTCVFSLHYALAVYCIVLQQSSLQ